MADPGRAREPPDHETVVAPKKLQKAPPPPIATEVRPQIGLWGPITVESFILLYLGISKRELAIKSQGSTLPSAQGAQSPIKRETIKEDGPSRLC